MYWNVLLFKNFFLKIIIIGAALGLSGCHNVHLAHFSYSQKYEAQGYKRQQQPVYVLRQTPKPALLQEVSYYRYPSYNNIYSFQRPHRIVHFPASYVVHPHDLIEEYSGDSHWIY